MAFTLSTIVYLIISIIFNVTPQFNERAQVIQIQRQGSDTYKGRLSLKNEIYPFPS